MRSEIRLKLGACAHFNGIYGFPSIRFDGERHSLAWLLACQCSVLRYFRDVVVICAEILVFVGWVPCLPHPVRVVAAPGYALVRADGLRKRDRLACFDRPRGELYDSVVAATDTREVQEVVVPVDMDRLERLLENSTSVLSRQVDAPWGRSYDVVAVRSIAWFGDMPYSSLERLAFGMFMPGQDAENASLRI